MGLRFRKSFKIAPGVRVNIGKKSMGVSFGGKGFRYSINTKGQRRRTVGIPGTGIYYTETSSSKHKTSSYNRNAELKRLQAKRDKLEQLEQNRLEVSMFENRLEMIKSLHKEYEEPVDWYAIKNSAPPFNKREAGPYEMEAAKELESYRPGFFEKMLKKDEKKRQELAVKVAEAKKKDEQAYAEWEKLVELAGQVLEGNIDAYFQVLEEMAPFDNLAEFGSGFEFFAESPDYMEIIFDVHTDSVIPEEIKSLTKTGKVSVKKMPKSQYFDLQQDYVCSCAIRIAKDMFSLLPLEYVVIHANDDVLNTATGYMEKQTLLSVKIDRATLDKLNLDLIDCSDAMDNFPHNMKFLKTKGLQPVNKINI